MNWSDCRLCGVGARLQNESPTIQAFLCEVTASPNLAAETLRVLEQLLIVLMLVEILHIVRISIRSHVRVTELFLLVGLIASIRRILGDYTGSRQPHKTWDVVGRGCEHISSQHDRTGLVGRLLILTLSIFHYAFALVRSEPEKLRKRLKVLTALCPRHQ